MIEHGKKDIRFTIEKVRTYEKEIEYVVILQIAMRFGWIERVKISLGDMFGVRRVQKMDYLKKDDTFAYFKTNIILQKEQTYYIYFSYEANGQFFYHKKNKRTGPEQISQRECWDFTPELEVPDYAKEVTMVQVIVDRTWDSEREKIGGYRRKKDAKQPVKIGHRTIHENWNEPPVLGPNEEGFWNVDFYLGNLKGLQQKLDYIQSFGTSILYLNPINYAQSNHGYDACDYMQIDPYKGTKEDMKQLCEEAHKRGIHIVLDAVYNHTGNDSKYFNQYGNFPEVGAYQSKESPYNAFYKKNEKGEFCFWWGFLNTPVCDGNSEEWQQYIYGVGGVIDEWFSWGIDGLRLDVADELTDSFIKGIRNACARNKKDFFLMGEVWKNLIRQGRKYQYYMHSPMNYFLVDGVFRYFKFNDITKLKDCLNQVLTEYPSETRHSSMNFTSTHDISRLIELFGCDDFVQDKEWGWDLPYGNVSDEVKKHKLTKKQRETAKMKLKPYVATLAFLPGNFSIFLGDEVGQEGLGNLANRGSFPWDKVEEEQELISFFQEIGNFFNNYPFLKEAEMGEDQITPEYFAFERFDEDDIEGIWFVANRTDHEVTLTVPERYKEAEVVYNINNSTKDKLAPCGVIALKI